MGQCGVGNSISPILKPKKVYGLEGVNIVAVSAGTSHSVAWTSSAKSRQSKVPLDIPSWMEAFKEEPITLLRLFLEQYGLHYSGKPMPPFQDCDQHHQFIVLCLNLLTSHCALMVQQPQKMTQLSTEMDKEITSLRSLLFRMLDMELPASVQGAVGDALLTGTSLLLPPLKDKLVLLLEMLKNVENLSKGQALLCGVIFNSFEDHQQTACMLGLAKATKQQDDFTLKDLTLTDNVMSTITKILSNQVIQRLEGIDANGKDEPVGVFYQKLHELLTSLQNHLFAHCICSRPFEPLTKLLTGQLEILLEENVRIYKKVAEILGRNSGNYLRVASILYSTVGGAMLSRVLHTMLLTVDANIGAGGATDDGVNAGSPLALIGPLISLVLSMEDIVRKLPFEVVHAYYEEDDWNWDAEGNTPTESDEDFLPHRETTSSSDSGEGLKAFTWFMDMQRSGSHLLGRMIGVMIRGPAKSKDEMQCNHWLTSVVFSHGLEESLEDGHGSVEGVISEITEIMVNRQEDWMKGLKDVLYQRGYGDAVQNLFGMIFPLALGEEGPSGMMNQENQTSSSNVTCLYELMLEHAKSLDWDTCDLTGIDDEMLDSVSRLMLLALLKHTGVIAEMSSMTVPESRHSEKLGEVFALVFQLRVRLQAFRQAEIAKETAQLQQKQREHDLQQQQRAKKEETGQSSSSVGNGIMTIDDTNIPWLPSGGNIDNSHEAVENELDRQLRSTFEAALALEPIGDPCPVGVRQWRELYNAMHGGERNQPVLGGIIQPLQVGSSSDSRGQNVPGSGSGSRRGFGRARGRIMSLQQTIRSDTDPYRRMFIQPGQFSDVEESDMPLDSGPEGLQEQGASTNEISDPGYFFMNEPSSRSLGLTEEQRAQLVISPSSSNHPQPPSSDRTDLSLSGVSDTSSITNEQPVQNTLLAAGGVAAGFQDNYEECCRLIVKKCLLLLLGVKAPNSSSTLSSASTSRERERANSASSSSGSSSVGDVPSEFSESFDLGEHQDWAQDFDMFTTSNADLFDDEYEEDGIGGGGMNENFGADNINSPRRRGSTESLLHRLLANTRQLSGVHTQQQRKEFLHVSRLGKGILKFVSYDVFSKLQQTSVKLLPENNLGGGQHHHPQDQGASSHHNHHSRSRSGSAATTTQQQQFAPEGWQCDVPTLISALVSQQERAKLRIEALTKILQLISGQQVDTAPYNSDGKAKESQQQDFLGSVHEFLLAGCYHLGLFSPIMISAPQAASSTIGTHNSRNTQPDIPVGGGPGSAGNSNNMLINGISWAEFESNIQLCHYLDSIQAAPFHLQKKVVRVVHRIMAWLITCLRKQCLAPTSVTASSMGLSKDSGIPDLKSLAIRNDNDQVKLLNLFALSCRFRENDIRLVVNSGVLGVLEKYCLNGGGRASSAFINGGGGVLMGKITGDIWSGLPYPNYVTVASIRLLHMIAVSTSLCAHKLEESVVEKVVEVLFTQLLSLLTLLCGNRVSTDGGSPTPIGTPDTPVISLSPVSDVEKPVHSSITSTSSGNIMLLNPVEKQEIEMRLGDLFVFLRRLIGGNFGGLKHFFAKPHWIKLLLSFLSVKPCSDVEMFLKFDNGGTGNGVPSAPPPMTSPASSSAEHEKIEVIHLDNSQQPSTSSTGVSTGATSLTEVELQMCRNILVAPGLRSRMLSVNLLESILTSVPKDSSDLKDQVVKDLLQQLGDCLWATPVYERAKRNILCREEVSRYVYGESSLSGERDDGLKVSFDPDRSLCCFVENNQTLVHGRGGRGYGVADVGFSSGCHQWKFLIVKENRGNEGTCIGVCRWPIKDPSHRSTDDMWLYRAYSGNLYHRGELPSTLPSYTQGDYITVILDCDNKTLSFGKNGEEPVLAFQDVDAPELYPCVLFYSTNPGMYTYLIFKKLVFISNTTAK